MFNFVPRTEEQRVQAEIIRLLNEINENIKKNAPIEKPVWLVGDVSVDNAKINDIPNVPTVETKETPKRTRNKKEVK